MPDARSPRHGSESDPIAWTLYGPDALLLRFAPTSGALAFHRGRLLARELERHPPPGLLEWVPGFTTLLLLFHPGTSPAPALQAPGIVDRLQRLAPGEESGGRLHEIPVRYDGPDLQELAEARGLSVADVIRLHSAPIYRVHLLGFAPGFPYLGELDPRLHTPRRSTPRPHVRAGSVAIGGEHTGIYPVDGPGGWNLIGRTEVALFDPARAGEAAVGEAMFLLRPGDRVRFVPLP